MVCLAVVSLAVLASCIFHRVAACSDHGHVHARRAPAIVSPPTRPLVWGDINVIHTTDSHGWLLGHQKSSPPEPNYSGDFGDFASFVSHMKEIARRKRVDLLLVDSGDLHDGTGLSDGFPPGGVDAQDSNEFIKQLPYDILAIGNHELYIYANTLDMHMNFGPHWKGRYLSSNVNITLNDARNRTINVPVGSRYAKFRTQLGRKVTSLGVLFDFTGNDKNTTVQKVADMVKEQWFAEAIAEEPDLFLLVGHMPVQEDNWPLVFDAIRAVHPTTPILIFGGHTHIRDCVQFDGRSMALESGRYMETVGWMSVELDKGDSKRNLTFSRRYLDPNRATYEFHTERNTRSFDTKSGRSITRGLNQLAERFDLSFEFGTAPQDYYLSRASYPSNDSLLSLFIEQAVATALATSTTRGSIPSVMITNSGSLRFDLYAGPFTKNDQLTVSPFTDAFLYLPDVPYGLARQVLPALNGVGAAQKRGLGLDEAERYARGEVDMRFNRWLRQMAERAGSVSHGRRAAPPATLGYVTNDSCPGIGDDTAHEPLPFFALPDFIGSTNTAGADLADETSVDLVFVDFIEDQLLSIVNTLQSDRVFATSDVQHYSSILANAVLGVYAQSAWS